MVYRFVHEYFMNMHSLGFRYFIDNMIAEGILKLCIFSSHCITAYQILVFPLVINSSTAEFKAQLSNMEVLSSPPKSFDGIG